MLTINRNVGMHIARLFIYPFARRRFLRRPNLVSNAVIFITFGQITVKSNRPWFETILHITLKCQLYRACFRREEASANVGVRLQRTHSEQLAASRLTVRYSAANSYITRQIKRKNTNRIRRVEFWGFAFAHSYKLTRRRVFHSRIVQDRVAASSTKYIAAEKSITRY